MGGVVVRRIVGALILFVTAVLLRADGIFHPWSPTGKTLPCAVQTIESARADTVSRKPSGPKRRLTPPDYRRNPLIFFSRAPKDSLILLPGVGPVLAERIVGARTGKRSFTRWDDLLVIKGIGPKTVERLKKLADEAGSD
jgi:predicted flap endonuclease-1-like 5' DNA nuclease